MMSIISALGLPNKKGITALIGGGGKTSLMFAIAREACKSGNTTAVTTTTKIYIPKETDTIKICMDGNVSDFAEKGKICCFAKKCTEEKLCHPGDHIISEAVLTFDRVFAEADGAQHLPIKVPSNTEPVYTDGIHTVIAVAGLDALGKSFKEICFRYELACDLLNTSPDDIITPEIMAELIVSTKGYRKNIPDGVSYCVVLNKADNDDIIERGRETAEIIRKRLPNTRVIITALESENPIKAVYPSESPMC